ncbi:hypothetical protein M426DRAFT_190422 [Hypoxylon sp. CI-4A]|nr:hypothetical protein M426DRAFT_190422 [Hypoxylon sp. CI-4A]
MCFTMLKRPSQAKPTRAETLRRRLTINPELGTNSIKALKRAIALASFITPTVVHFQDGKTEVYLSAAIQRHLRKVYDSLRRGQQFLSREAFIDFLETVQGEKTPELTIEKYNFERFLETWWLQFSLKAEIPAHPEQKDLSKPISNYFISSSHNTYLSGNQLSGRSNADAYRRVLERGCRCVEIDVWNSDSTSSTPERPRDGSAKPPSRFEHVRHLSGSSMHTAAAHIKGTVEDTIDKARHKLGVEKIHSHSPKCSDSGLAPPPFGRELGAVDPGSLAHELDPERSSLRSRPSLPPYEPIVMHGYTFTAPIGFREVCRAIREVAFKTNNLPIIVSLEVHANEEQQGVMVQIMKEEWAGLLVEKPHETCPNDKMPRLEDLLNRILVKVKRSSPSIDSLGPMSTLAHSLIFDDDASGSEDDRPSLPNAKKPKVPICESLSALAIYTHSEHFTDFGSPAAKIPSHIFSINENKILELGISRHHELFTHNRHFFMRAYPKGSRVDSSNPDPSQFWRKGVQMVAMNWQSWDEGMMLNEAMFSGEHGWVLKPPGYRGDDALVTSNETFPHGTLDLVINILAGQHIPLPEGTNSTHSRSLRPIVKCELHVEKTDDRSGALVEGVGRVRECDYKQKTGSGRTDHPDFNSVKHDMHFLGVHGVIEQLSFVR